jgi:hypothetical protein
MLHILNKRESLHFVTNLNFNYEFSTDCTPFILISSSSFPATGQYSACRKQRYKAYVKGSYMQVLRFGYGQSAVTTGKRFREIIPRSFYQERMSLGV